MEIESLFSAHGTSYFIWRIEHGDLVRPNLFLLCTQGLASMLQQQEDQGELYGIRDGSIGLPISDFTACR
jgi:hypothetical protein